jgi:superfamily I DNA/RNA helicase
MLDFHRMYRDVQVVNLTENYRSTADIIHASRNVAVQIQERLVSYFPETSKHLIAANNTLPASEISRCEFLSDIAQAQWVATKAKQLIDQGTHPRDIAVLAPKHRQLEHLVPYLNAYAPVSYEKRDDILQARVVRELIAMSRLVLALHDGDELTADSLWPEVLSYDFWRLPVRAIWEISWKVADARKQPAGEPGHTMSWSRALLAATRPLYGNSDA